MIQKFLFTSAVYQVLKIVVLLRKVRINKALLHKSSAHVRSTLSCLRTTSKKYCTESFSPMTPNHSDHKYGSGEVLFCFNFWHIKTSFVLLYDDILWWPHTSPFVLHVCVLVLQVEVIEGCLQCPESGREFPITRGIPNMLLNEDEV